MHKNCSITILNLILQKYGTADLRVFGDSMFPSIKNGDNITITKLPSYSLNDIVVFQYKLEGLIVHRIIKIEENTYYCKGDNATRIETINKEHILGKVCCE